MSKVEFRIDWGYQMLYSRRLYHPEYCWDGELTASDPACRMQLELLRYPVCWWGIVYSPETEPVTGNAWQGEHTRRGVGGLAVAAECAGDTVFTLTNRYGRFSFSVRELEETGRIVWPVGWKYGFCAITVTRKGFLWFRPAPRPGEAVWEAAQLPLPRAEHRRLELARLNPGESLTLPVTAAPAGDASEVELHFQAMILKPEDPALLPEDPAVAIGTDFSAYLSAKGDRDYTANDQRFEVTLDDGTQVDLKHYFRFHDLELQLLEDVWCRLPLTRPVRQLTLRNADPVFPLWLSRVTVATRHYRHLELELPHWGLAGHPLTGRVFAARKGTLTLTGPGLSRTIAANSGWNEFTFSLPESGVSLTLTVSDGTHHVSGTIEAIYRLAPETPEVMVGCDFTTVPHDANGDMDRILDYIARTQMGNTVVFRAFRPYPMSEPAPDDALLERWGEFCRDHRIYVQSVNCHRSGALERGAGAYMHNGGWHEFAGGVYASDPVTENQPATMAEAAERFMAHIRADVERNRKPGFRYAYGDAGGGARYLMQAGLEYIRAETMVPHTQHLCSLVRPSSRAFGRGDWGVHIAIQHPVQLYQPEWHFGQYFLSLFQPWMMGASNIYEEDCLFLLFKEEQQGWDDALTRGKREMTREFFRFVATHPRRGELRLAIASVEGRNAAPFNGFVCGPEQDPSYRVWGGFGNPAPEWAHLQPEKSHQLLDVLMPGASTHPLRQQEDKRRFFFSGTPYGDFDQIPVEAGAGFFQNYRLLLNLGWHTANAADQRAFEEFVAAGGTYFAGLPEYSTHTGREFLRDMDDLALWRDGDLREFCGIRVRGPGECFSGKYTGVSGDAARSRTFSFTPDEDGPCRVADVELAGAETVVADAATGKPLIVRFRYGRGTVYTLCTWCYPGHEALAELMAVWLRQLCREHRGEVYVEDATGEVFWNVRDCGHYRIAMLLNTDWTTPGNRKPAVLHTPEAAFPLEVTERQPKIVYLWRDGAIETNGDIHIDIEPDGRILIHGCRDAEVTLHRPGEVSRTEVWNFTSDSCRETRLW